MTSRPSVRVTRALARRERAERQLGQARAELHAAIADDIAAGVAQADLARSTGYTRERIRQITREAGVRPPERAQLTSEEYAALRARAGGKCELCGTPEQETAGKRLVVDHFASGRTAFVRGLLCDTCNGGVMVCLDGHKPWGANRMWEASAREYEARSFQRPSPAALEAMAARQEMPPKAAV